MKWFKNWFCKERGPVPVQTMTVVPQLPDVNDVKVAHGPRKGMWVTTSEGRVGIVLHSYPSGLVDIVRTKADGTNVMILTTDDQPTPLIETHSMQNIYRALISEIPPSRYESVDQLRALGYGDD